ncbi:MAG: SRPBCC family protein [Anaerolineae bacterium]
MTTTIKRFIYIDAPPEAIDAVGLDPTMIEKWFPGVTDVDADDDYPAVGSSIRIKYRAAGLTFDVNQTLEERQPGELSVIRLSGIVDGESRWIYTPEDNRTKVSVHYSYAPPNVGGIGWMFEGAVERATANNLEQSLRILKQLVEAVQKA